MDPTYWQQAKTELSAADPKLGELISRFPNMSITSRGDAFHTLARSIAGQQISVKAADSIWKRLEAALPEITPQAFAERPFRAFFRWKIEPSKLGERNRGRPDKRALGRERNWPLDCRNVPDVQPPPPRCVTPRRHRPAARHGAPLQPETKAHKKGNDLPF